MIQSGEGEDGGDGSAEVFSCVKCFSVGFCRVAAARQCLFVPVLTVIMP